MVFSVDNTMRRPKGKGYNCFIIFFCILLHLSVPISHLCVKFGKLTSNWLHVKFSKSRCFLS